MRGKAWKGGYAVKVPAKYCFASGKVCYDKKGAQTAANARMDEAHEVLRIYPCPNCHTWHLTSTRVNKYDM